jgi:hypothetical protein
VVHLSCGVDLSRLDSRALQMESKLTFVATGMCGSGLWTWGSLRVERIKMPKRRVN